MNASQTPFVTEEPITIIQQFLLNRSLTSTWHPTGFLYLTLAEGKDRSQRLHIWPSQRRGVDELGPGWMVHCHDWHLSSRVLAGTLVNHTYKVLRATPGHSVSHRVFRSQTQGLINHLDATDELVSCVKLNTEVVLQDETYHIPAGVYHSTQNSASSLIATMVTWSRHGGAHQAVLGDIGGREHYELRREPCTIEEIHGALEELLEHLQLRTCC